MTDRERLKLAVQYAIDSNYGIHQRAQSIAKQLFAHKHVCVFGTGEFFDDCADEEHLPRFDLVCDNNPEKWGKYYKNCRCVSPKELTEIEDIGVIIMVGEWRPIYAQLKGMGIDAYPMDWYVLNVYDSQYNREWFEHEQESILKVYDILEDDESREVYVEAICNRIAPPYAKKIFNEIKIPGEYFQAGVLQLTENEYFVDAGAYTGDSIEKILLQTGGKCGGIYSFELDSRIFEELKRTAAKYESLPIELFNAGVSDKSQVVNYGYRPDKENRQEKLVALDDVLGNKPVTFIKMDVETFEIPALNGARFIIQEQHPKLAISAYHYLSDLWNVPLKIKELDESYRIYLRHHSPVVWDTDCYAV